MSPAPADAGVASLDVPLRPGELVAAWRPESRRLVLTTRAPLRAQQRLVARIVIAGSGAAATITGRVVTSVRQGDTFRIELAPDELRVCALERLLALARGDAIAYQPRAPRLLAALPAVVRAPGATTYMNTFSVSENGCGLAWSGPVPLPAVGVPMDVRLGAGSRAASFQGVVCWTARSGRASAVGVRFVSGARSAWAMLLRDLRSSGAPPA